MFFIFCPCTPQGGIKLNMSVWVRGKKNKTILAADSRRLTQTLLGNCKKKELPRGQVFILDRKQAVAVSVVGCRTAGWGGQKTRGRPVLRHAESVATEGGRSEVGDLKNR